MKPWHLLGCTALTPAALASDELPPCDCGAPLVCIDEPEWCGTCSLCAERAADEVAARERDALDSYIAEKVMGLLVHEGSYSIYVSDPGAPISSQRPLPPYSTDIAGAWKVVEELQPDFWFRLVVGRAITDDFLPRVDCYVGRYGTSDHLIMARADTPARAICLAAQALVEGGHR